MRLLAWLLLLLLRHAVPSCAVLCCAGLCADRSALLLQLEGVMQFTACVMGLACLACCCTVLACCCTAWLATVLPGLRLYLTAVRGVF